MTSGRKPETSNCDTVWREAFLHKLLQNVLVFTEELLSGAAELMGLELRWPHDGVTVVAREGMLAAARLGGRDGRAAEGAAVRDKLPKQGCPKDVANSSQAAGFRE